MPGPIPGKLIPATWDAAIKLVADKFASYGSDTAVIASPRLTNESIGALASLTLLGEVRSLGELIERTPGLDELDAWGREP